MKIALCTLDGQDYEAATFAAQSEEWIQSNRNFLECKLCRGPAFFRKASTSGQAACFGARPHSPDCKLATISSEQEERKEKVAVDVRNNKGRQFDMRMSGPKKHKGPGTGNHPLLDTHDKLSSSYTKLGRNYATTGSITAKECLINLALSDEFRKSTQKIRVSKTEGYESINDFFISFDDIKEPQNKNRGYWGTLFDPGEGVDVRWLNTGRNKNAMSVVLEPAVERDLLANYGLTSVEDLAGAYVLVVGKLQLKASTGKLWLKPKSANYVVLYIPDELDE